MALLINVLSVGDHDTSTLHGCGRIKDIFREQGDSSSLATRDVAANKELKRVTLVYK